MSNFCLLLSNTLQYLNFRLRYFHNWDVRMFRIVPLHETHLKFTQNVENLFDIKIVFLEIFIYIKEQSNLLHLFGPHRRNGWSWILWNQFPGAIGRNDTTKVGHFDVNKCPSSLPKSIWRICLLKNPLTLQWLRNDQNVSKNTKNSSFVSLKYRATLLFYPSFQNNKSFFRNWPFFPGLIFLFWNSELKSILIM